MNTNKSFSNFKPAYCSDKPKFSIPLYGLLGLTGLNLAETSTALLTTYLYPNSIELPVWMIGLLQTQPISVAVCLIAWLVWFGLFLKKFNTANGLQLQNARLLDRKRLLLDTNPSVLYAHEDAVTSPYRCTFITGNIEKMIGYTSQQVLADAGFWQQHLHPADKDRVINAIKAAVNSGLNELNIEYRFHKADGNYCWIRDHANLIRSPEGKLESIIGSWIDISNTKSYENELLRLRMAAEASVDMIMLTDIDSNIEYVNPSFCAFTGWQFDEVIGMTPRILKSGKTPVELYTALHETLLRGEPWRGRLLNRRKKTKTFPIAIAGQAEPPDPNLYWAEVSITPLKDDQGSILGYVSIQRDISEQVHIENQLSMERMDTEARLRIANILDRQEPLKTRFGALLDELFSLKSLAIQHKGGVFLREENSQTMNLFLLRGSFSEEFIRREQQIQFGDCLCGRAGKSGELLISDDCFCDPRHDHQFENMVNHGHYIVPLLGNSTVLGVMFLYTDPYPPQDDTRKNTLVQIGHMMGLAILQDLAGRALEEARDIANESSRQKSEFLANMSHEIRTPMNGVLGMLDLLQLTPLTEEQTEFAKVAYNSAESLLYVINDILDFSKIESGKLLLENIEFDVRQLTEEICILLSGRAHAKNLELNCFVSPDLPAKLIGDPNRLRQILNNLIGNAVKFTTAGEVSVELTCIEQTPNRAKLHFSVKDTGIGIRPEQHSRLFQPFVQANSATTRRFGGTGLGLSIAKNLVEYMHGEIGLDSTPGVGSNFWFTAELEIQTSPQSASPKINGLSGCRILIVDDNATNRQILSCFLSNWGASSETAENAAIALEKLQTARLDNQAFDLAILDMQMPDMDGLNLARIIEADPALQKTHRILLSSGSIISEAERISAGIAKVLSKPIRQSNLYDILANIIHQEKPQILIEPLLEKTPADYNGRKVLLVEDNATNQKVALYMLARLNLETVLAKDGQEAIIQLEHQHFDLILMDCQMPIMDGFEATRLWRLYEHANQLPRTPIIALTANAMQADMEACLVAGMDDHMSKPFNNNKLLEMLNKWLDVKVDRPSVAQIWQPDEMLQNLDGDQELLDELIWLLIKDEAPQLITSLNTCLANNDASALSQTAHTLKGIAGQFCAKALQSLAAQLEADARQGIISPLATENLIMALEKLCAEAQLVISQAPDT